MSQQLFQRNIRNLYLLNFFSGLMLWFPIEKLFMLSIHIDPFGISVNAAVYLAVLVLFDIPAGILADKWSRKYTSALSIVALSLSCFLGGISNNFLQYLPMTILIGIHVVLANGTFQALMYDSLKEYSLEKQYDKFQGKAYGLYLVGFGISSLAGGYVSAWYGYRWAYFISAIATAISIIFILLLKEPKVHKAISDTNLFLHSKASIQTIFTNKLAMQLALLFVATGMLRNTQNEFGGLYFLALGLTAIPIGYAIAAKWIFGALGQFVASKFGRKSLTFVPLFFIVFLVFSLIHSLYSIIFFFLASLVYGIIANQTEAAIQDNTPSALRATTLSVITFAENILLIPVSLLFGWITDTRTVFDAYLLIALGGLIYLISWFLVGRKQLSILAQEKKK